MDYARAYLVALLAIGAAGGAVVGAVWGAFRIVRCPVHPPRGGLGRLTSRIAIVVAGAGLTALIAYLGAAPRFAGRLSEAPRTPSSARDLPPNVILVSLDTVRPDHLGAYGYAAARTPVIDGIASRGTLFRRCVAASSWTIPSHAAMFTGIPPSHIDGHVVHQSEGGDVFLPEEAVTLAEIFRAAGYHTAGFIGGRTVSSTFGFEQGFEVFNDGTPPSLSAHAGKILPFTWLMGRYEDLIHALLLPLDRPTIAVSNWLHAEAHQAPTAEEVAWRRQPARYSNRAPEVNRKVTAWLQRRPGRPFFLFVHYFDAHDPYSPPAPYVPDGFDRRTTYIMKNGLAERILNGKGTLTEAERATLLTGYDGEIAHVDVALGALMEALRAEGALENTVVALTSDHGESFGEHGLVFHGHELYDDLTRAVLILSGPGVPAGRTESSPVAGMDLAPTLLDLAGLAIPGAMQARSLVPFLEGAPEAPRPLFAEIFARSHYWESWEAFRETLFSVEAGGVKLIRRANGGTELYDLLADPGETRDLAAGRPVDFARLDALLRDYVARAAPPPADAGGKLSDEARESLRGLGYIK